MLPTFIVTPLFITYAIHITPLFCHCHYLLLRHCASAADPPCHYCCHAIIITLWYYVRSIELRHDIHEAPLRCPLLRFCWHAIIISPHIIAAIILRHITLFAYIYYRSIFHPYMLHYYILLLILLLLQPHIILHIYYYYADILLLLLYICYYYFIIIIICYMAMFHWLLLSLYIIFTLFSYSSILLLLLLLMMHPSIATAITY